MTAPLRKPKRKFASWKQIPTVALAGCTLVNGADSSIRPSPSSAILTVPASQDWSLAAPWLRSGIRPADFATPGQFLFQRDYVLGTSFDLVVWTTQPHQADLVEGVILAEIERLSRILNRYDSQSEISRLNAGHALSAASPDLIALLRAYEFWSARTGGALSGQLGGLIQIWKTAEIAGITPTVTDLAGCIERLTEPGWRIDPRTSGVLRIGPHALNVDGLGKGYILQKAIEAAYTVFPGTWGIMLNIGGDICIRGNGSSETGSPWRIFCADPFHPQDNAPPLTAIELTRGAVATSAAYERGFTVAGRRYSHIVDPRTGRPAHGVASATAIARDCVTANALATSLCILSPGEGLSLLGTIEGAEALIVAANGTQFRTPGFAALELPFAQIPSSSGSAPSTTTSSATTTPADQTASSTGTAPVAPGQMVTIVSNDPVPFVKGASTMKRPVQPDEKFKVVSVSGDQVTIVDSMGYQATLPGSSIKSPDATPASASTPPAVPTPTPTPSATATPSASGGTVTAGQIATVASSEPVSFSKGAAIMKRPVLPDEKFKVAGVNGDQVTITDSLGFTATLPSASLTVTNAPSPTVTPTPVAQMTATNPAATPTNGSSTSPWPSGYQVTLGLDIAPAPPGTQRVRRPYVAIWVEDADGKPVRTITVWGNSPKYLPDMSNWWKFAGKQPGLVTATTRATRDAGKYEVVWDGMDDEGKPAARGTYTIVLEVNRQHGAHEIHRGTIDCSDTTTQGTIAGATEFHDCALAYGPPSS